MNPSAEETLRIYRQNVSTLFEQVKTWMEDIPFSTKEESIELNEEKSGRYSISKLVIFDENDHLLAELAPSAAWVIGAKGRMDLVGEFEREILVYLDAAPSKPVFPSKHDNPEKEKFRLYKGIEQDGWYWIESKHLMRSHIVNQELFLDLLAEVSNYEFSA